MSLKMLPALQLLLTAVGVPLARLIDSTVTELVV